MGQSFWSRGPSLSTQFSNSDFPSLPANEDTQHRYPFVLHATIELTQLLHNSHDVLYAAKSRTLHMMQSGDYSRYLDDFRRALLSWDHRWGDLKPSPKLYSTLRILREYVRLYVHGFSFQAVLTRVMVKRGGETGDEELPQLFPRGISSSADGAYIFEALDAARNILETVIETDPATHVRFMPFRFYV